MPLTQLTLRQHNRSQHVSAQGFSSHPVVEPPPPPYCPPGKIPYGVLFTFGSADVGYNNLGGYPGGPDVKCTVGPHSDLRLVDLWQLCGGEALRLRMRLS